MPVEQILLWIDQDPESRSALIAGAAPRALSDDLGGRLTRELLTRYSEFNRVRDRISSTFYSGAWSGPTSVHLKKRREFFRTLLASGFSPEVNAWIDGELNDLDKRIEHAETEEERERFD